jgi:hypothetical protein
MFKKEIIGILKNEKVYNKIREKYYNELSFKETFDSIINTPFIESFFHFINCYLRDKLIIKQKYTNYRTQFSKKYKSLLIKDIKKEKFEEIQKYLYENGIIWCSGNCITQISVFDNISSICLMIENGRISWSRTSDFAYGRADIKIVSLEEFYPIFEYVKQQIKEYYKDVNFNSY